MASKFQRAEQIFRKHGGILGTAAAIREGIHPTTLYSMRDSGRVEQLCRGLYRLSDGLPLANPDLVTIAVKIPNAVLCLLSALSFHELTTQVPHKIQIAIRRGTKVPRLNYPPISVFKFTGKAFTEGVESHKIDGVSVRVYSVEKTLADCFKFRNKIGLDTAVEALRFYRERRKMNVKDIMRFAAICRVDKVVRPYIEALL